MPGRAERSLYAVMWLLACGPRSQVSTVPATTEAKAAASGEAGAANEPIAEGRETIDEPKAIDESAAVAEPATVAEPAATPEIAAKESSHTKAGDPRIPTIRVETPTVGPKWSPDLIRRVIRRADFSRCRMNGHTLPAAYRFTIDHDGAVTSAEARDAGGEHSTAPAHVCAVEVLRGLRFPVGMGPLQIDYPLP